MCNKEHNSQNIGDEDNITIRKKMCAKNNKGEDNCQKKRYVKNNKGEDNYQNNMTKDLC